MSPARSRNARPLTRPAQARVSAWPWIALVVIVIAGLLHLTGTDVWALARTIIRTLTDGGFATVLGAMTIAPKGRKEISMQAKPKVWKNGLHVFADEASLRQYVETQQVASPVGADPEFIAQVVAQVVATLSATPTVTASPAPKGQSVLRKAVAKQQAGRKRQARAKSHKAKGLVSRTLPNGHKVTIDQSKARLHAATGWTLDGPVTVFDGHEIIDHWQHRQVEDLGNVNELLPCRVADCDSNRHKNAQFCETHKGMTGDAQRAWKAAGRPKVGTPEHDEFMAQS